MWNPEHEMLQCLDFLASAQVQFSHADLRIQAATHAVVALRLLCLIPHRRTHQTLRSLLAKWRCNQRGNLLQLQHWLQNWRGALQRLGMLRERIMRLSIRGWLGVWCRRTELRSEWLTTREMYKTKRTVEDTFASLGVWDFMRPMHYN